MPEPELQVFATAKLRVLFHGTKPGLADKPAWEKKFASPGTESLPCLVQSGLRRGRQGPWRPVTTAHSFEAR